MPGTFAPSAHRLFQDKGSQMTQIYHSLRYTPPHKPTEFTFCSFSSVPLNDVKISSHPEINPLSNNILFNTLNSKLPSICHSKTTEKSYLLSSTLYLKKKITLEQGLLYYVLTQYLAQQSPGWSLGMCNTTGIIRNAKATQKV